MKIPHATSQIRSFGHALWVSIVLLFLASSPTSAKTITIASGSEDGMYNAFASRIESEMEATYSNIEIRVLTTEGTIENLHLLETGEADLALTQNDLVQRYHDEKQLLERNPYEYSFEADLRCVTGLYPEVMHIFVREQSDIDSIFEFRSSSRDISIGSPGSGTRRTAVSVLSSIGIDPDGKQFHPLSLKNTGQGLMDGSIDAGMFISGIPNSYASKLLSEDVRLLSLESIIARGISETNSVYFPTSIDQTDYQSVSGSGRTFGMKAILVAEDSFSSLWAQRILQTLDGRMEVFQKVNSKFVINRQPKEMLKGISIPLHPGTEEFLGLVNYSIIWNSGIWMLVIIVAISFLWWLRYSRWAVQLYRKWTADWHEAKSHRTTFEMSKSYHVLYELLQLFRTLFPYVVILLGLMLALSAILLLINYFELVHYMQTGEASRFIHTTFGELLVWTWILLSSGNVVEYPLSQISKLLIGTVPLIGVSGFLMITGKLIDSFTSFRKNAIRGLKPMNFENHIVIHGFNDRVPALIQNLQRDPMVSGQDLVLLAEFEEEDKKLFLEHAGIKNKDNVHVVRQSGDLESDARHVNLAHARTLVCMADPDQVEPDGNTILNLMRYEKWLDHESKKQDRDFSLYTVAELKKTQDKEIIDQANIDEVIHEDDFVDKLVAQTARKPGTSELIDELLTPHRTQNKDDLYMVKVSEYRGLEGFTFDELLKTLREEDVLLIGFRLSGNEYRRSEDMLNKLQEHDLSEDKKVFSNPSTEPENSYELETEDEIFVVAPGWDFLQDVLEEFE